jgi:hypothetical protein
MPPTVTNDQNTNRRLVDYSEKDLEGKSPKARTTEILKDNRE